MYCSMVSAIVSATSSSEYSWSENKLKSGDLNSSRLSVLKCFLDDQNSRSGSLKDDRYAVFNRSEYAGLESVSIWRIQGVGYDILKFLEVETMLDIFQNILFPYSLNTAYCLSWILRIGSCVLRGLWCNPVGTLIEHKAKPFKHDGGKAIDSTLFKSLIGYDLQDKAGITLMLIED
ncbi:hypothetical protein Tco_1381548 [Tanacetum coccineum]